MGRYTCSFQPFDFHFTHRLSLDVERYGDLACRESQSAGGGKICPRFNIADSHDQLCCSPLNPKRAFLCNDIITILTSDTDTNSRVVRSRELPGPHSSAPREIDSITGGGDMTPTSLDKMHKLDSFIKESQRFGGGLSARMLYIVMLYCVHSSLS